MYNTVHTDIEFEELCNPRRKIRDKVGGSNQRVLNVFRRPGFLVVVV
jgi:hypothetical protein